MTTARERALEAALRSFMKAHTHLYVSAMADDCERSAYDEAHDEGRAALALPPSQPDSVNADMLAALRVAHHALEGRERKDVALDAVAAAIARATS